MEKPVLVVTKLWWPFGAHLLFYKWAYIYSLMNGYDFFYKYNDFPAFVDGKVEHYFENVNTIDESELNSRTLIYYTPTYHDVNTRGHYLPNEYADAEEFHSFILKKIYCPNERVQKMINSNRLINTLKENNIRYIAVHIRLGDKINGPAKETDFIPIEKYFDACKELKNKYGLDTIVICSDTSCGLENFELLNSNNEFKILFNDETRPKNVWEESFVVKCNEGLNDVDKMEAGYFDCFINCQLLLNSEIIVGNWDSCFCVVPVEMRNNKKDINVNNNFPLGWFGVLKKIEEECV
jgi:hypothetical protein